GAYVSHHIGRLELHMLDDFVWHFGLITLRALEPTRAFGSHHPRDLAAHIPFADAVGVVLGARCVHGLVSAGSTGGRRTHAGATQQCEAERAKPRATPHQPGTRVRRHWTPHNFTL